MKAKLTTSVLFLGLFLMAFGLRAEAECPDKIQFKNGQYLKRGDQYFYSNGSYLLNGGRLYYSNGSYLKNGDNLYYPNGTNLRRGAQLFYPNGSYLKNGDRLYYSNGSQLKNGTNFYHSNGSFARRNGQLYRPDGTMTAFPLTLSDRIGAYGTITADVQSQAEYVTIDFRDLIVNAAGVQLGASWNGETFSQFDIVVNSGTPGEDVFVTVTDTAVSCSLSGGGAPNPNTDFYVDTPAAAATVHVKSGYKLADVRRAVENALNSLGRSK